MKKLLLFAFHGHISITSTEEVIDKRVTILYHLYIHHYTNFIPLFQLGFYEVQYTKQKKKPDREVAECYSRRIHATKSDNHCSNLVPTFSRKTSLTTSPVSFYTFQLPLLTVHMKL